MPMRTPSPRASAALAALVALGLTACSDSSGPKTTVPTPEEAEVTAAIIAAEVASAALLLQPSVDEVIPVPLGAISRAVLGGKPSSGKVPRTAAAYRAECGAQTPAVPLDSDDDGIPNTVTVTFTLPDCHFVDDANRTTDLTGSVVVSDPTVNTAGLSYRLALRSLRILLTDPDEGTLTFSRNGTGSVDHTAQELLQEQTFTTTVAAFGQSASFTTDWTALFRAATGSAIEVNGPLPDGTFAPSGSMSLTQGGERFAFTVETAETLVYSADCAEDLFGDNPFTDGTLRANITGAQGNAHVLIEFGANGACLEPRITYHGSNTAAID